MNSEEKQVIRTVVAAFDHASADSQNMCDEMVLQAFVEMGGVDQLRLLLRSDGT